MYSATRRIYLNRLNKWFSLKSPDGYLDQKTPKGDPRRQLLKHCDSNNDEDIRPSENINNDYFSC